MTIHDFHLYTPSVFFCAQIDLKNTFRFRLRHRNLRLFQISLDLFDLFFRYVRDHFQFPLLISRNQPCRHRRFDSMQSAGMRNDHTFHIFNDIPAGLHFHPLCGPAQGSRSTAAA